MALKNLFGAEQANAACGSACGSEDKKPASACGAEDKQTPSACGAEDKKEALSACGSACGTDDNSSGFFQSGKQRTHYKETSSHCFN